MKKLLLSLFVCALVAPSAHAISLKGVAKGVSKAGVEVGVNNALSKETGKCRYANAKTTTPTGCSTNAIISALNAFRKTAEKSGYSNDVNIVITAFAKDQKVARARAEYLRDQVHRQVSWWDYEVYYKKGDDSIDMKVEVN